MAAAETEFTFEELRRMLALEITRADASFVRSQIEARAALARDLVPNSERLALAMLEIDRMELRFELVAVRAPWWRRSWSGLHRLFGRALPPGVPRFRFAAAGEQGVSVSFVVRRDARGRVRVDDAAA